MDFNNVEEVYQALRDWEYEAGEDILDGRFGSDIELTTFMVWALGAKHITTEKFDKWYEAYNNNEMESEELNQFLYNGYDDEIEYAIVETRNGEWNEDEYEQAFRILAQFITDFTIYQERFKEFLENGAY